ncbi:DNA internalization-related competence protein ComEC/Rec2 [Desulfogranum japonicum]|uniref:DNA internalization-related competence protein ComEC/Rec2 n=1 Tax=Desulfogranum japonicum TaxID=231447 RepID=UPI000426E430|nr:DNA internalization-related competence protein ComEC/Rec2 [Desulfogranum japonicum]
MKHLIPRGVDLCRNNLLIFVTCAYATGIAIALQTETTFAVPHLFLITLLLLVAGLFTHLFADIKVSLVVLLLAFAALGYAMVEKRTLHTKSTGHLANHIHQKTKVTLIGTVTSMVVYDGEKSSLVLAVSQMMKHVNQGSKKFIPIEGKVRLAIRAQLDQQIQAGTSLITVATISQVRPRKTPGTFNYARYLAEKDIFITGWISKPTLIEPIQRTDTSLFDRIRYFPEQLRQHFTFFFASNLDRESASLYQALLLGYRANVSKETLEKFKIGGVLHILAISGLHLGLLAAGMTFFLMFWLKRSHWLLLHTHVPSLALTLTVPALLAYSFIAGMNLPVFRALIMAILATYAILLKRFTSPIHLIAAAALLVLIISPLALATASFQLSFMAVLGIVLVTRKIGPKWLAFKKNYPWKALLLLPPMAIFISVCATLATLPIMLTHFGRISLIGPMVNLLVEPLLCFWALPLGLTALPLSYMFPQAALSLLHLGEFGFYISDYILSFGSQLPIASIWTISPAWWEIAGYYTLLSLTFIRSLSLPWKIISQTIGASLLLYSFTYTLWNPASRSGSIVHFIDVGQGSSTLLELQDGTNILIDAGGKQSAKYNVGEAVIAPFLRKRRIWKIKTFVISHPHSDHYNGIPYLLDQYPPETLYINGQKTNEWRYLRLLTKAKEKGVQIRSLSKGERAHQGSTDTLLCLGTPGLTETKQTSTNDNSLVLLLQTGSSASILLPGDITKSVEALFNQQTLPAATILVAPHHGSTTSTSRHLLQTISPKFIIVSSGFAKRDRLPAPRNVALWKKLSIPFTTTAISGTMRCNISDNHMQLYDYKENILYSNK